jgi:hypothetical protein
MALNLRPILRADATLLDKITSEKAVLEVHHSEREDRRMRMVLIFLGLMALMTLVAGAIPAIGFENAWKVTGPVIGVGAGMLVNASRRST